MTYVRRSPTQIISAMLDVPHSAEFLAGTVAPFVIDGFVTHMAWGQVAIQQVEWLYLFRGLAACSVLGSLLWLLRASGPDSRLLVPSLVFLAIAGALIWINTILRPLPLYAWNNILPAARYAFPAAIPTALLLAGGWLALWPRRYRDAAGIALVLYMLGMNCLSIWTLWSHFNT